jgi:hypothetical protein
LRSVSVSFSQTLTCAFSAGVIPVSPLNGLAAEHADVLLYPIAIAGEDLLAGLADRHVHPKSGQRPLDYFPLGDPAEVALEKREVGLGVRAEGDVEVGGSRVLGCHMAGDYIA